jgi:hypothetical protein
VCTILILWGFSSCNEYLYFVKFDIFFVKYFFLLDLFSLDGSNAHA